jgi:hypothetical protein
MSEKLRSCPPKTFLDEADAWAAAQEAFNNLAEPEDTISEYALSKHEGAVGGGVWLLERGPRLVAVATVVRNAGNRSVLAISSAALAPAESGEGAYKECSGDPASCPENEGYGCCKPNHKDPTAAMVGSMVEPVQMNIFCPVCKAQHVDRGEWATRPHKTHQCQAPECGHEWRPFDFPTVGVAHQDQEFVAYLERKVATLTQQLAEATAYRANFLWPYEDGSIEALGYEFANGKTEAYRKEVWEALVRQLAEAREREKVAVNLAMEAKDVCASQERLCNQILEAIDQAGRIGSEVPGEHHG